MICKCMLHRTNKETLLLPLPMHSFNQINLISVVFVDSCLKIKIYHSVEKEMNMYKPRAVRSNILRHLLSCVSCKVFISTVFVLVTTDQRPQHVCCSFSFTLLILKDQKKHLSGLMYVVRTKIGCRLQEVYANFCSEEIANSTLLVRWWEMLCRGRIPRRECNAFVFGTSYVLSTLTNSQLKSPFENDL